MSKEQESRAVDAIKTYCRDACVYLMGSRDCVGCNFNEVLAPLRLQVFVDPAKPAESAKVVERLIKTHKMYRETTDNYALAGERRAAVLRLVDELTVLIHKQTDKVER